MQLERVVRLVDRIAPDRVQLNTATRPPSESFAQPVPMDELKQAARSFGVPTDVVYECSAEQRDDRRPVRRDDIINLLRRRPCTLQDVATSLDLHLNEATKHVDELVRTGVLVCRHDGERGYYQYAKQMHNDDPPGREANSPGLSKAAPGE